MTKNAKTPVGKTLTAADWPGEKLENPNYPGHTFIDSTSQHSIFLGAEMAEVAIGRIGGDYLVMIGGKVDRDIKTLADLFLALSKLNGSYKPHVSQVTGSAEENRIALEEARKKREADQFMHQINSNEFIQAELAKIFAQNVEKNGKA